MREHSMRLSDFQIGLEFWMSGSRWRCTDVGTRLVIAIKLDHDDDPSWYNGPPYAVCECPIDEYAIPACSLTRYGVARKPHDLRKTISSSWLCARAATGHGVVRQ
jgi:hypothetical protein